MELNKTLKVGLSTLEGQISEETDQTDYILVTKEKAVSKHKVFKKIDKAWVDVTNKCEPSDILSDVGLNKSEEVNLIKNENDALRKKIEELNLKILQLEEALEDDEEEEEEEEVIKKKKVSGKSATQEKIKDDIIKYFNDNRITDDSLPEDFNDFSVTMNDENDSDGRIETLKNVFDRMVGGASESVYRSFIELELLHKLYLKKFGNKMGKSLAREDLSSIIITKKKPSTFYRKASRFYYICRRLKKGAWKECVIAPTYWESINGITWNSILENLNIAEILSEEEENSE